MAHKLVPGLEGLPEVASSEDQLSQIPPSANQKALQ
jgi:hypothetical protein